MLDYLASLALFLDSNRLVFGDMSLLRTALTHRSYLNEHPELEWRDNERLEYLGDGVLDFLLADFLYRRFPEASEGELTIMRAALVRRDTLARFARALNLGEALLMGHGEVDSGGRKRSATLCASFEALTGALFLDQGLEAAASLVMPMMEGELDRAQAEASAKDPKSRLQELAQSELGVTPRYKIAAEDGPAHERVFTVEAVIGDTVCGTGSGRSKQDAAQNAAEDALTHPDCWPRAPFESLESAET
jgi:ribonuclease III